MATKSWSDFLPEVLPDVRDCPPIIARNAVRNAAIEFCERTNVWRMDLDPVSAAAGVSEYDLVAPVSGAIVWQPMSVNFDGRHITPKSPDDLDRDMPGWATERGEVVHYFTTNYRRSIRLVRTPGQNLGLAVRVNAALKPSKASTTIDERFFEEFYDDIAAGARAKLMAMAQKAWTNNAKASENQSAFDRAIARHTLEQARAGTRAPLRVTAVYSL